MEIGMINFLSGIIGHCTDQKTYFNNQASDGGNDNNSGGESFDETELKSTLEAISKDENLLPALKWLKTCLNDEKEDREEDDENIADMPLVIFERPMSTFGCTFLSFFPLVPPWKL